MRIKLLNYLAFVLFLYSCHSGGKKNLPAPKEKTDSTTSTSPQEIESFSPAEKAEPKNAEKWLKKQVDSILLNKLGIDVSEIVPNASLTDDLGADSLDVVEIIIAVEDIFRIHISDETAEKIKFVKDLYEVSNKRR